MAVGRDSEIAKAKLQAGAESIGSGFRFSDSARTPFWLSHLPNIQYLCGFSGSAGFFWSIRHERTLSPTAGTPFRRAKRFHGARVQIAKHGLRRACRRDAAASGGRAAAWRISPAHMTVAQKQRAGRRLRAAGFAGWTIGRCGREACGR